MKTRSIPRWVWLVAGFVLAAQVAAVGILLLGRVEGPTRNLLPQVLVGGLMVLVVLAAYVLRSRPEEFRTPVAQWGVFLLTLMALGLVGLHVARIHPILSLAYDVASWSEPMFVVDVIKLRIGAPLFLPPEDSNSNVYTPAAPAFTYFLAWLLRRPTSIVVYRVLLQLYLVLAAIFAAAAAGNLLRLVAPERFKKIPRAWFVFFFLTSFLFASNGQTNVFNVYLHNDPLAVLISTIAFWLLTQHALTRDARWLWAMAIAPAASFMVKQNLAIWAVVYLVYFLLDGGYSLRRILAFAAVCFAALGAAVGGCRLAWGDAFRYWAFEVMGTHIVSLERITARFGDAAWYIGLGLVGGWVLFREKHSWRLLGIWMGWLVMVLGGVYTSGVTYYPSHLGSASIVAGCFALAALARTWPDTAAQQAAPSATWFRTGLALIVVFTVFAGLGFVESPRWKVSPDLSRYVGEIEREFQGLPTARVLLDGEDWVYLRQDLLMKDRAPILLTHRTPHFGLIDRIREKHYAKILVHRLASGRYWYELGGERGIHKELLAHYREVRVIPRVRGMDNWLYSNMMLGDVVVLEPNPATSDTASARQTN